MVGDCGQWLREVKNTGILFFQCYPRSPQKMAVATIGGSTRFVPSWSGNIPLLGHVPQAVVKGWTKAPKLLERLEAA